MNDPKNSARPPSAHAFARLSSSNRGSASSVAAGSLFCDQGTLFSSKLAHASCRERCLGDSTANQEERGNPPESKANSACNLLSSDVALQKSPPANDNAPERWAPIPEHAGYEVSDRGRVRHGDRILKPFVGRDGYLRISLRRDGDRKKRSHHVHLWVAEAFLGACPDGHEVDHVNGDKADPSATNLEYVTHSENMLRALARGQWKHVHGERHGMAKLDDAKARLVVTLAHSDETNAAIGRRLGVANQTVSQILRGEIWGHATGLPRLPRRRRLATAPATKGRAA